MTTPKIPSLTACNFHPNFDGECHVCGASPTVTIPEHPVPETDLCGRHFFNDRTMLDWNDWNSQPDTTE